MYYKISLDTITHICYACNESKSYQERANMETKIIAEKDFIDYVEQVIEDQFGNLATITLMKVQA